MTKITIWLTALTLAATAVPAFAQYERPLGVSVRFGVFLPSNGRAQEDEGENWFVGGVEYKIRDIRMNDQPNMNASLTLSADYLGKGDYTLVPVQLNWVGRREQVYFGAGAGVGFTRIPQRGGGSGNDNDVEFAFNLAVGYDFVRSNTPLFVEARYFGCGESRLNGFGFYAGARF